MRGQSFIANRANLLSRSIAWGAVALVLALGFAQAPLLTGADAQLHPTIRQVAAQEKMKAAQGKAAAAK